MIGFRSGEAACGHCPLSLLCLRGKPLIYDKIVNVTHPDINGHIRKKIIGFNEFNVKRCPRCLCVHFSLKSERYLCGILRTGLMTPSHAQGWGPVYHAIGGRYRKDTIIQECTKNNSKSLYDCFDEFKKVLNVIY